MQVVPLAARVTLVAVCEITPAAPGNSFAHDRDEVGLLVLPVAQVAAVETNGDRLPGRWQARTVSRTAGERKDWFGTEFGLESAGDAHRVATN